MAIDREALLSRAEHAYEFGRARRAAALAVPLLALVIIAALLGATPATAVCVGLGLLASTWFFLWRGQSLGRSVLPGIVAGLIPLALAVGARAYGHVCTGSQCFSLCIPACTLGGALAGFVIAYAGRHARSRGWFFFGASVLAALVGAFGCSCVGFGGVIGLGIGLVATLVPAAWAGTRKLAH
jgi:hypothetical protein